MTSISFLIIIITFGSDPSTHPAENQKHELLVNSLLVFGLLGLAGRGIKNPKGSPRMIGSWSSCVRGSCGIGVCCGAVGTHPNPRARVVAWSLS
ncbi:hypothetical protein BDBG_01072 [Blastomyces gilchristii SLH14081]|uniref:Uncharacterized protein n=1 Tax=Blastomyces gilchristii (strain SLH14081) TaxID=559298 RepID=A0A179UB62_BLAGS|nr:uncharacterized protein BDBG_01072 [Blastomyces gilchristii SLH14081]OAT04538.1 hypothetical protein BDBG_01072 [Blastomyces gilchristii SLH14081]